MMKRGDNKKQDIKKDDRSSWQLNDHPKKRIYNIEENGGKPQKIYIRTYYNSMGLKIKYEINIKDAKRVRIYA